MKSGNRIPDTGKRKGSAPADDLPMDDATFLEWWDGCAWWKGDPALDAWPRHKIAQLAAMERQKAETVQLLRQWDRLKGKIATLKKENAALREALHGRKA